MSKLFISFAYFKRSQISFVDIFFYHRPMQSHVNQCCRNTVSCCPSRLYPLIEPTSLPLIKHWSSFCRHHTDTSTLHVVTFRQPPWRRPPNDPCQHICYTVFHTQKNHTDIEADVDNDDDATVLVTFAPLLYANPADDTFRQRIISFSEMLHLSHLPSIMCRSFLRSLVGDHSEDLRNPTHNRSPILVLYVAVKVRVAHRPDCVMFMAAAAAHQHERRRRRRRLHRCCRPKRDVMHVIQK